MNSPDIADTPSPDVEGAAPRTLPAGDGGPAREAGWWRTPWVISLVLHAALVGAGLRMRASSLSSDRYGPREIVVELAPVTSATETETDTEVPAPVLPEPSYREALVDPAPDPPTDPIPPEELPLPEGEPPPGVLEELPSPPDPTALLRPRSPPSDAAPPAAPPPISVTVPRSPTPTPVGPRPTELRAVASPDPPLVPEVPAGTSVVLVLEYTIAADGRVIQALVTASSGYPALDASTREFVLSHWRYEPPGTDRRVARRFVFRRRN